MPDLASQPPEVKAMEDCPQLTDMELRSLLFVKYYMKIAQKNILDYIENLVWRSPSTRLAFNTIGLFGESPVYLEFAPRKLSHPYRLRKNIGNYAK